MKSGSRKSFFYSNIYNGKHCTNDTEMYGIDTCLRFETLEKRRKKAAVEVIQIKIQTIIRRMN